MKKTRFYDVIKVFIGFLLIFALLIVERNGILYKMHTDEEPLLKVTNLSNKVAIGKKECVLITDSSEKNASNAFVQFKQILTDMRIAYEVYDIAQNKPLDMSNYKTAFVGIQNYDSMEDKLPTLMEWTKKGGRLLQALPVYSTDVFKTYQENLGIKESQKGFFCLEDFKSKDGFMLGAQKTYPLVDPYESSMNVSVTDDVKIFATNGDESLPVIWSKNLGQGKVVVCNFGYVTKAYRGIFSSAYSLLEDVCVYPVINGSAYYLDDFPSPTPLGDGKYIKRDYKMDIATFYSSRWWPDLLKFGDKYGNKYTGLIIESYNDKTKGKLPGNQDISSYQYFGNMLLKQGGEIGIHGYNHQPLCLQSYAYKVEKYHKWESYKEMKYAVKKVKKFTKEIFPESQLSVYVPPSNVLSSDGRKLLGEDKNIKVIASTYFPGGDVYEQEFEIAKDGVVETPRIISSCILDDHMRFSAFSELNFHYVNSHFMHPDDLLDVDRGADIGWENLKGRFDNYMSWLQKSAPKLRNLTGTELGGAVQRYCNLSVEKDITKNSVNINLKGLNDEAYCFVRVNEGDVSNIKGAKLEKLTGNLYIMKVKKDKVTMKRTGVK
ncbi:DUF2194 domain-containing protein [Lachnobacterium bovis]|uniref:DUF2194 domain-containing protein n=1 Tax=Lachnobacterium bovis TaxID=140626 RepID=A0A1H9PXS2_9FIRM|nr:DUF2194 domain-containing protein [Lachnobacterium bovis]SER52984.1 hypothetical protein SAMN02910429_00363 [Lachnobacterium bovis]